MKDGWGPAQRQFCCAFAGSGCPLTTAPLPAIITKHIDNTHDYYHRYYYY